MQDSTSSVSVGIFFKVKFKIPKLFYCFYPIQLKSKTNIYDSMEQNHWHDTIRDVSNQLFMVTNDMPELCKIYQSLSDLDSI